MSDTSEVISLPSQDRSILGFGGGLAIIQPSNDSIKEFMNISPEQFATLLGDCPKLHQDRVAVNSATYVDTKSDIRFKASDAGVATCVYIILWLQCSGTNQRALVINGALEGIRPVKSVGLIASAKRVITIVVRL